MSAYSGSIVDGGGQVSLLKAGDGELILSGSDTFSGAATVEAGTFIVGYSAALPDQSLLTVDAGSTFIFDPSAAATFSAASPALAPLASVAVTPVPEPGTLALLVFALWSAAIYRRFLWRSSTAFCTSTARHLTAPAGPGTMYPWSPAERRIGH